MGHQHQQMGVRLLARIEAQHAGPIAQRTAAACLVEYLGRAVGAVDRGIEDHAHLVAELGRRQRLGHAVGGRWHEDRGLGIQGGEDRLHRVVGARPAGIENELAHVWPDATARIPVGRVWGGERPGEGGRLANRREPAEILRVVARPAAAAASRPEIEIEVEVQIEIEIQVQLASHCSPPLPLPGAQALLAERVSPQPMPVCPHSRPGEHRDSEWHKKVTRLREPLLRSRTVLPFRRRARTVHRVLVLPCGVTANGSQARRRSGRRQ